VDPFAEDARGPAQVGARVDPHRPTGVDQQDRHAFALLDQDREDVVQVVLALRVLAAHERERAEQLPAPPRPMRAYLPGRSTSVVIIVAAPLVRRCTRISVRTSSGATGSKSPFAISTSDARATALSAARTRCA